jgi:hypothetical protein
VGVIARLHRLMIVGRQLSGSGRCNGGSQRITGSTRRRLRIVVTRDQTPQCCRIERPRIQKIASPGQDGSLILVCRRVGDGVRAEFAAGLSRLTASVECPNGKAARQQRLQDRLGRTAQAPTAIWIEPVSSPPAGMAEQ